MRSLKLVVSALAFFACIAAHADQLFTYSGAINYSSMSYSSAYSFRTGPISVISGPTLVTQGVSGSVFSTITGPNFSVTATRVLLDGPNGDFTVTYSDGEVYSSFANFTLANYRTPGVYTDVIPGGYTNTLIVTNATPVSVTPEPSSLLLLGTGLIGSLTALRRRVA